MVRHVLDALLHAGLVDGLHDLFSQVVDVCGGAGHVKKTETKQKKREEEKENGVVRTECRPKELASEQGVRLILSLFANVLECNGYYEVLQS